MKLLDIKRKLFLHSDPNRIENIHEGLITSWSLQDTVRHLNKIGLDANPIPYDANTQLNTIQLLDDVIPYAMVVNVVVIDSDDFNKFQKAANITGYFPTDFAYIENGRQINKKYNPALVQSIVDRGDHVLIGMEAKYPIEIDISGIQSLWHVTPIHIYEEKIQKIGLVPKSHSKKSVHPERIYMTLVEEAAIQIYKQLAVYAPAKDYALLEIDASKLNRSTRLFLDPDYFPYGVFTQMNIPPRAITFLKKLKV